MGHVETALATVGRAVAGRGEMLWGSLRLSSRAVAHLVVSPRQTARDIYDEVVREAWLGGVCSVPLLVGLAAVVAVAFVVGAVEGAAYAGSRAIGISTAVWVHLGLPSLFAAGVVVIRAATAITAEMRALPPDRDVAEEVLGRAVGTALATCMLYGLACGVGVVVVTIGFLRMPDAVLDLSSVIRLEEVVLGLLKCVAYGWIIAVVAAWHGLYGRDTAGDISRSIFDAAVLCLLIAAGVGVLVVQWLI